MKKHFLILSACLFSLQLTAQVKDNNSPFDFRVPKTTANSVTFTTDPPEKAPTDRYNKVIDSAFKLDKNYAFEFRLWKLHLSQNFDNVFILTLKDGIWSARYFDQENRNFVERKVDQTKAPQLWSRLSEHQILTLPKFDKIRNRLINYELDTTTFMTSKRMTSITDGILYSFELKSANGQRRYDYGNPNYYFKQFRNVEELGEVVALVMLVQKYLGKSIEVY